MDAMRYVEDKRANPRVSAAKGAARNQVISAAHAAWPDVEPFEKEGYVWVGRLGLRFNEAGQLVEAVPNF